jgi:hypothetical protein
MTMPALTSNADRHVAMAKRPPGRRYVRTSSSWRTTCAGSGAIELGPDRHRLSAEPRVGGQVDRPGPEDPQRRHSCAARQCVQPAYRTVDAAAAASEDRVIGRESERRE